MNTNENLSACPYCGTALPGGKNWPNHYRHHCPKNNAE